MAENDYAILMGINHYPQLSDLSGPENDALAFKEWLTSAEGGQVPVDNVDTILSSDFATPPDPTRAQPTSEAFKAAIDKLVTLGAQNEQKAGHRLYLFFAGHGFAPHVDDAVLLMANAAPMTTGHHVQGKPYADWFRQAGYFDEVVLFMDCCSEHFKRALLQPCHLTDVSANGHEAEYCYGFASKWSQPARERTDVDHKVKGYFTSSLLAGLAAGGGPTGEVTPERLRDFVLQWFDEEKQPQEPRFAYSNKLLLAQHDTQLTTIRLTVANADHELTPQLQNGNFVAMAVSQHVGPVWEWRVPKGLYSCNLGDGRTQGLTVLGDKEMIDVEF